MIVCNNIYNNIINMINKAIAALAFAYGRYLVLVHSVQAPALGVYNPVYLTQGRSNMRGLAFSIDVTTLVTIGMSSIGYSMNPNERILYIVIMRWYPCWDEMLETSKSDIMNKANVINNI